MFNLLIFPSVALGICWCYFMLSFFDSKKTYAATALTFFIFIVASFRNPFLLQIDYGYSLSNLVGSYFIFVIIMFSRFGVGDCRFTMSKIACWYSLGLCLILIGSIFNPSELGSQICMIIGLMVFIGAYPFSGWLDHYMIHTSSLLFAVFCLFIRPIMVWLLALLMLVMSEYSAFNVIVNIVKIIGVISVIFIPLLYFVKKNFRRLLAYIVIVQSGFSVLFMLDNSMIAMQSCIFAFVQGVLLVAIFNILLLIQKINKSDSLVSCNGIVFVNKNIAYGLIFLLSFVQVVDLYVIIKSSLSIGLIASCITSVCISLLFIYKLFCSFCSKIISNNNLIQLNLIDKLRLILLLSAVSLIFII